MKKQAVAVGLTLDKFKGIKPSILLKVVKKLGLEFAELTISAFDDLPACKEIIGHMQTGFHLPNLHDTGFDFSCQKMDEKIQKLIRLINDNYLDLKIQYCVAHPPESNSGSKNKYSIAYLINNLNQLKPPVIIENIQGWTMGEFHQFFSIAQSILGNKLTGLCFDVPHFILIGKDPIDFLLHADSEITCIHLSDCQDGFDAHMPFGKGGCLPVDAVLKTIKKIDFHGFINLELLPRNRQDVPLIIKSYLKVIKTFSKKKYFVSFVRLLLFQSQLHRMLNQVF